MDTPTLDGAAAGEALIPTGQSSAPAAPRATRHGGVSTPARYAVLSGAGAASRAARSHDPLSRGPQADVPSLDGRRDQRRELLGRAREDRAAERRERGGIAVVVARRPVVGEGEQDDQAHAAADDRGRALEHLPLVA